MGKQKDWYSILGWVAMVAVPIAPAFYFGFEFAKDVYGRVLAWPAPWLVALALGVLIGFVSAVGLELVGILSGHNAIRFLSRKELEKAAVCAAILAGYVALGIAGLESWLAKGVVMFLVAPLVYLLVGMQKTLETAEVQEQAAAQDNTAWQRRQEIEQAQREHELALARLDAEKQERIAQAEAKAQADAEKARQEPAKILAKAQAKAAAKQQSDNGAGLDTSKTDWRTLTNTERLRLVEFSPEQIVNQFGVSRKTADRWLERAGELSKKVSANGHG